MWNAESIVNAVTIETAAAAAAAKSLQSCPTLCDPIDREASQVTVHGVTKSRTQMSHFHFLIQVKGLSSIPSASI